MEDRYLIDIVLVALAAGVGLSVFSVRTEPDYCPQPSASTLFAPCHALEGQQIPPATQLAARSAAAIARR
jgi:hypothetical protein